MVSVVGAMGGAQAQLLSAAELAIWARTQDLEPGAVETSLWEERDLARAWCMRRTVHLLPSKDLAVYVRGSSRRAEKEVRWMTNRGVPKGVLEGVLEVALSALGQPLTKSELIERVGRALGLKQVKMRGGGWGSDREVAAIRIGKLACPAGYLLHLVGARGVVCSAPNRGTEPTYVRADAWLPHWRDIEVERAEVELLKTYLRAFGPATASDFFAWTRMGLTEARTIWDRAQSDLARVDIEGRASWILREDLRELERAELETPAVRLLPYFDSFLLGHEGRDHLMAAEHLSRVYRPQGWIAPVLLVNGRARGVWSHDQKGGRLRVRITPFSSISRTVSAGISEEGRELGRFLGCAATDVTIGRAGPQDHST